MSLMKNSIKSLAIAALTAGFLSVPLSLAQSERPEDLAQGSILIMQRDVPDPIFSHSVIVLAHNDNTGAVGLIIHYRSDVTIRRALAGIEGAEKRTDTLFVGGPVELEGVMALLRSSSPPADASPVAGKLYLVTSKRGIASALSEGRKASDLRIFLGYAGWGPGQLAREVRQGGWYIFDYDESLVFDEHPETLWKRLFEKTELLKVLFPYRPPR